MTMDRRLFTRMLTIALGGAPALGALAQDGGAMQRYLRRIRRDLARVRKDLPAIDRAGGLLAERVSAGGRLLIYDLRGEYTAEALGRAGGLMGISRVGPDQAAMVAPADALLALADEPANATDLALVQAARAAGALVVGICPARPDEGSLSDTCDLAIDNYVTDADAAVVVRGAAIAPASGVLNTAILWAVIAAYIEAMEKRRKPPHVWMSIKRPGAKDFNDAALAATREAGF
jgi:uncharacterized phosphosugar-binding protein